MAARHRVWAALSLCLAWLVFFLPALAPGTAILERDLLHTVLPWRTFMVERFRAGHLPEWYPYDALGGPFLAQIVTAVFHPASLLYFVLSPVQAVKWNVLLAFAVALGGAYRAARALGASRAASVAAAGAFGFGGYTVGVYDNIAYLNGMAALPWSLAAAARLSATGSWRHAGWLAFVWALVLLGGDAQSFLLAPLLFVPVAMESPRRGRTIALLMVAGACAALIAAISLAPALALLRESSRGAWTGAVSSDGGGWALHPRRLLELVVPGFLSSDWRAMAVLAPGPKAGVFAAGLFVGGIPLLLAFAGVSRRRSAVGFAAIVVLSVLLAFGSRGPLPWVQRVVPLLAKFRYPEKYLAPGWVAALPLMAFGFDRLRVASRQYVPVALVGAMACAMLAALSRAGRLEQLLGVATHGTLSPTEGLHRVWAHGALTTALALVGAALLLFASAASPRWLLVLAAGAFVEPWLGNLEVVRLTSTSAVVESDLLAQVRGASDPPARVRTLAPMLYLPTGMPGADDARALFLRQVALPDLSALDGVPSMGSALPALSRRDELVLHAANGPGPFDGLLNGCFAIDYPRAGQRVVSKSTYFGLALLPIPCRPRAYVAPARAVPDIRAALAAMRAGLGEKEVAWEGGPSLASGGGTATWRTYEPERLALDVDAKAPSALVINDALRTGWLATVDGAPAEIHPTNVAVRGVEVPAGMHHVEMRYRTPALTVGIVLSLIGLAMAIACGVIDRLRRPVPSGAHLRREQLR